MDVNTTGEQGTVVYICVVVIKVVKYYSLFIVQVTDGHFTQTDQTRGPPC